MLLAGMAGETIVLMLKSPAFVLIIKIILAAGVALSLTHAFLWAVGKENKARIDELKEICENAPPK